MASYRASPTAKDAIEALIVILKAHANQSVSSKLSSSSSSASSLELSAELLRRGKHNVADASLPLWRFLHCFLRTFFKPNPNPSSTPSSYASTSSSQTIMIEEVKFHLISLGYPNVETLLSMDDYQEEEVESRREGVKENSRELMLAFGWLLARFQVIARLYPFSDENGVGGSFSSNHVRRNARQVPSDDVNNLVGIALGLSNSTRSAETTPEQHDQQLQHLKRLQWELGKLNLTWRKWSQTRLKRDALEKKVKSLTKGYGLSTGSAEMPSSATSRSHSLSVGDSDSATSRNAAPERAAVSRNARSTAPPLSSQSAVSRSSPATEPSDSLSATEALLLSRPRNFEETSKMLDGQLRYLKAWLLWREG